MQLLHAPALHRRLALFALESLCKIEVQNYKNHISGPKSGNHRRGRILWVSEWSVK